jgi:hypothetical protein
LLGPGTEWRVNSLEEDNESGSRNDERRWKFELSRDDEADDDCFRGERPLSVTTVALQYPHAILRSDFDTTCTPVGR